VEEGGGAERKAMLDWAAFGVPRWLADRAERLNFGFPLAIQRNALDAVVAGEGGEVGHRDAVVLSQTGSGKTMAYLVPVLAALSEELFRVEGEVLGEGVGKAKGGKRFPMVGLVLVPTKELAVQVCLLAYKLLGGSLRKNYTPGDRLGMFQYGGPRGIRVVGVFDDDTAERAAEGALLEGVHIVVAVPRFLVPAVDRFALDPARARAVAVDELDAILEDPVAGEENMAAMKKLLRNAAGRDLTILCGASVVSAHVRTAQLLRWIRPGPAIVTELGVYSDAKMVDALARLPPGLVHRVCTVDGWRALGTLTKIIRRDCDAFRLEQDRLRSDTPAAAEKSGSGARHPRIMVFAPTEAVARGTAEALQDALWGVSGMKIAVLLPRAGVVPLKVMEWFRDGIINVLVLAPESARGLDFPMVSHVYNLYGPLTVEDYLHRAGRAGRVGQVDVGIVTSVVAPSDQPLVAKLEEKLGLQLNVVEDVADAPDPEQATKEEMVSYLNDIYSLYDAEEKERNKEENGDSKPSAE